MAFTFRGVHASGSTNTEDTFLRLVCPGGVQPWDLLVATVVCENEGFQPDITGPAGWTRVTQTNQQVGSNGPNLAMFYKIATSSDVAGTTIYDFSWPHTATGRVGALTAYKGVHRDSPFDKAASGALFDTNMIFTPAGVVPLEGNELAVGAFLAFHSASRTFTPDSRMTERADLAGNGTGGDDFLSLEMADHQPGEGQYTATASALSGICIGALALFRTNPPPTVSLGARANFDATTVARFPFTFSDIMPGDSQTAYQLQILRASNGFLEHDTGEVASASAFRDLAANTLANGGQWQWQARVKDIDGQWSPWSPLATFHTSAKPSTAITSPATNGEIVAAATLDITHSYLDPEGAMQGAHRTLVKRTSDGAVHVDSGKVSGTGGTFQTTGLANNTGYTIEKEVWDDKDIKSSVATRTFTTSFTPPPTPSIRAGGLSDKGHIALEIEAPDPTGSQPAITAFDLYRLDDGVWVRIAAAVAAKFADPTFTRASIAFNPETLQEVAPGVPRYVAGKYGKGVLIEEGTTNLATWSEQFDNASWSKTNATIIPNAATAPDGTATADKFVEDTTTGEHRLYRNLFTTGSPGTATIYAKAAERTRFAIRLSLKLTIFDLATGTIVQTGLGQTAKMEAVGNGWYRCSVSDPSVSGSTFYDPARLIVGTDSSYTGDGTSGIYVWGAQGELKTYPTSYIRTEGAAATRNAEKLTVPTAGVLSVNEGTIAGWAYVNEIVQGLLVGPRIFAHSQGNFTNMIDLLFDSGHWKFRLRNAAGIQTFINSNSGVLPTGFHHFAIRWSASEAAIFIDGAKSGTAANPNRPEVLQSILAIGHHAVGGGAQVNSIIDDPGVYSRALTDQEIADLYNFGSSARITEDTTYKLSFDDTLKPPRTYLDYAATSGEVHEYKTRARADDGSSADSASEQASIDLEGVWLHDTADPAATAHNFLYDGQGRAVTRSYESASFRFAGRELPVTEDGDGKDVRVRVRLQTMRDETDMASLRSLLARRGTTLCYRDPRHKVFGTADTLPEDDRIWGAETEFSITGTDYREEV